MDAKITKHIHPRLDDHGKEVIIHQPSEPSALETFTNPEKIAVVVPDGKTPAKLNTIGLNHWTTAPASLSDWVNTPVTADINELPLLPKNDKKLSAGVVVIEPDGRFWVVAPTNAYGGYKATFPKGTIEPGMTPQATAVREALEEAGLQVQITDWIGDFERSTSVSRYYLAQRISGNPALMGWESQAVMLIPRYKLSDILTSSNDKPLLEAIENRLDEKRSSKSKHELIGHKPPLKRSHINSYQAEHFVELICRLEASVLEYFQVPSCERIPIHRFMEIFALPDYRLFLTGAYASGFVCQDFSLDFDLNEVNRNPGLTIGYCEFPVLRHYIHTLIRGERWADGYSSPILEALVSGALRLVATRLKYDFSIQENT